jgi:hypothetical protein
VTAMAVRVSAREEQFHSVTFLEECYTIDRA